MPVPALPVRFQSTLPCRSDRHQDYSATLYMDFNPRSLAGATKCRTLDALCLAYFNPRSLAGATVALSMVLLPFPHFNPRSLAGATPISSLYLTLLFISIHAPLRERPGRYLRCLAAIAISIHAPLRERPTNPVMLVPSSVFQSTLPCGSDFFKSLGIFLFSDFNPRSLAGAT